MSDDKKTIDVIMVNFDNPSEGLPALAAAEDGDPNCDSARVFYEALKKEGLTDVDVSDYTIIQYDRIKGNKSLINRKVYFTEDPERPYCSPEVEEVKKRLQLEDPERDKFLLVIEDGAQYEDSIKDILESLEQEGYKLNYYTVGLPV